MRKLTLSILSLISTAAFAEQVAAPAPEAPPKDPRAATFDVAKVSEAFGHLLGKNLESMGVKFDIAKVVKGLQDASEGRTAPMTETECVQAITSVQEIALKEMASENLQKAEEFLSKNSSAQDVKVLQPGKLQYRIEKEGTGPVVDEHSAPLIRYTGKLLDGTVFSASKEEERFDLDEAMPGFSQGLIGMKEGEKRTLYIHPELGYGSDEYFLLNNLLTYEVEIVKAQAPSTGTTDSVSITSSKVDGNPEIANPFEEPKVLR